MKYKCINCSWEGEKLSVRDPVKGPPASGRCPVCGDAVEVIPFEPKLYIPELQEPEPDVLKEEPKPEMDLDGDGKETEKDVKIAAKVTRKLGSKLKKAKKNLLSRKKKGKRGKK